MNAQTKATIDAINAVADGKIAELAKDSAKYADNMGEFLAKMNAINTERNQAIEALMDPGVKVESIRLAPQKRWYQNEALQVTAGVVGGFTLLMFGTMVGTGAGVAVSRKVFGVDLAAQPVNLVYDDGVTPADMATTQAAS